MLSRLHIRNYVLVDSLDVEFPEGLVIVSGPTGAGKSIIVGALGLLAGAKADAAVIEYGAENCIVEGEFVSSDSSLPDICTQNDIECEGDRYVLRRMLSRTGRSRNFVNDCPVPLSILAQFGKALIDIHSQHETLLLTDKTFQLSVLDKFAGNAPILKECAALYAEVRDMDVAISKLTASIEKAEQDFEFNKTQLVQLEKAAFHDGELQELEAEQHQLANSEEIKQLLCSSVELLDSSQQGEGINSSLCAVVKNFEKLSSFLPSFASFAERMEEARIEIKDLSEELYAANDRLSFTPDRLQWLDDRLSLLYSLMKKHDCATLAELAAKRDALACLVGGEADMQEQLDTLVKNRENVAGRLASCAEKLHSVRLKASDIFSSRVMESLSFMELDGALFTVELSEVATGPDGKDELSFMFAGKGGRLAPVAKCASGGEMSRIMLAMKEVMSTFMNIPTIVFDEIDTGVSGSVADRMGDVVCRLGDRMQVFAITHLPQVAAKGQAHYLVEKSLSGNRAFSTIKKLSSEQRVQEIARMLSGSDITPEALANAKSLLR